MRPTVVHLWKIWSQHYDDEGHVIGYGCYGTEYQTKAAAMRKAKRLWGDNPSVKWVVSITNPFTKGTWHQCQYERSALQHDGTWKEGELYEWLDRFDRRFVARMRNDGTCDRFDLEVEFDEADVIAFREIRKENL